MLVSNENHILKTVETTNHSDAPVLFLVPEKKSTKTTYITFTGFCTL